MKRLIVRYLTRITLIMVLLVLLITLLLQVLTEQRNAHIQSEAMFHQIEQVLTENQSELKIAISEYTTSCLYNAETIAYILEAHPDVADDIEELRKIAKFIQVDEIHIFDTKGCIISGTHPEYFGYTFDSGEQISFFKPMLEDKTLKLVQKITPNTAENKLMQYSAVWSENQKFIVQVGMEPIDVMKVTEKNELSYIFSLLRGQNGVNLYAIDAESGEIMGTTVTNDIGKHMSEIGFDQAQFQNKPNGFHSVIEGAHAYCIFKEINGAFIVRVINSTVLYEDIPAKVVELTVSLLLVAVILVSAVSWYMNKYVVERIYDVNNKLRVISGGKLDEKIDEHSTLEFSELSNHINEMIRSIMSSTDKISFVLNKTDLRIGVYEYNENMRHVRFTEYIPELLGISTETAKHLTSDYRLFKEYLDNLRMHPVPEEKGIYSLPGEKPGYVKLEEIIRGNDILGIIMDVTENVLRQRAIENERDLDLLTGLYNRRGLEARLTALFETPEELGHGALVMIDADGLKGINDQYGHEKGDIYLRKISEVISSFGRKSCICSRQGGDEFVLFLYNYTSHEELMESLETLTYIQNNSTAYLADNLSVPLRFSFGYSLTKGHSDFRQLLKEADKKMYASKIERKALK